MKGLKRMVNILYNSFSKPITGIYSLCKLKLLFTSNKGCPEKSLLSAPAIQRPFKEELDNEKEQE